MLHFQSTREESAEDEAAVWAVQHLREAVLNDDCSLLDHMLCQELYRRAVDVRGGWGVACTPLRLASSRGSAGCVRVLLAHGASVDRVDAKAQTPLFAAVCGRRLECARALLAAGADPNGSPFNNCSPVLTAAREGDVEILRQLLRHGAEVNSRSRVTLWASPGGSVSSGPLYLAALYGHMDCFHALLQHGADPDYNCGGHGAPRAKSTKQPKTVLEMCVRHGCAVDYVRLLIDFGANVYLPTLIVEKTTRQNDALELLLHERGTPKSLSCQCRLVIRSHLKKVNRMDSMESLDLPPPLISFLQHKPAVLQTVL